VALDGGSKGGGKVVNVDTHVYTSGPSRTVVIRRDKRGSVTYVYRTVYHHVSAPAGAHDRDPDVGGHVGRNPSRGGATISRQRLLKAAGFAIRVDGIWGPQSQRAWSKYLHQRGKVGSSVSTLNQEAARLRQLNRSAAASAALARSTTSASRAAVKRLTQIHDARLGGPKGPGRLSKAPLIIERPQEGRSVTQESYQRYIRETYVGDGDAQVAHRIMYITERLANPAIRGRVIAGLGAADLRTVLFDPVYGSLRGGSHPTRSHIKLVQDWLAAHGHKVRRDGRLDENTLRGLASEMRKLARQERREEIDSLVETFYDRHDADQILTDLPGFNKVPKPGQLLKALQEGDAMSRRLLRVLYRRLSARELADMRARQLKLNVTAKLEWQASREIAASLARDAEEGGWRGFLSDVGEALDWATDYTKAGWHLALERQQRGEFWLSAFATAGFQMATDAEIRREQLRIVHQFDEDHYWLGTATSILLDPTLLIPGRWFLAPVKFAGRGSRAGVLALEDFGFKVSKNGHILAIPSGRALQAPARGARATALGFDRSRAYLSHTPGISHGLSAARKATQTLADAKTASRLAVLGSLRHGMDASWLPRPVTKVGEAAVKRWMPKLPTEVEQAYDTTLRQAFEQAAVPIADLHEMMVQYSVSLYGDVAKNALSDFGALLEANLAQSLRRDAIHELAEENAARARRALKDKRPAMLDEEYNRVYDETIQNAGPYIIGHPAPGYDEILSARVNWRLAQLREVYFPVLQFRIESALDQVGATLWDLEKGVWARQDMGDVLRAMGRELFDEDKLLPVLNPNYGKVYSHGQMLEMMESELRIRTSRFDNWAARRRAVGEEIPEGAEAAKREELIEEIDSHWKEVEGGWTDTRRTLDVPLGYARQYFEMKGGLAAIEKVFASVEDYEKYERMLSSVLQAQVHPFRDIITHPNRRLRSLSSPGKQLEDRLATIEGSGRRELWESGDDLAAVQRVQTTGRNGAIITDAEAARFAKESDLYVAHLPKQGHFPEMWVVARTNKLGRRLSEGLRRYRKDLGEIDPKQLRKIKEKNLAKKGVELPDPSDPILQLTRSLPLIRMMGWTEEELVSFVGGFVGRMDIDEVAKIAGFTGRGGSGINKRITSQQAEIDRLGRFFKIAPPKAENENVFPALLNQTDDERALASAREAPEKIAAQKERDNFRKAFSEFGVAHEDAFKAGQAQWLAREGAFRHAMKYSQHAPLRALYFAQEAWLGFWRTMALPLRTGWAFINHVDNSVKVFLQGLHNPKYWMRAFKGQGKTAETILSAGWDVIRNGVKAFDDHFGSDMLGTIDQAFDRFWRLPRKVHTKLFKAEGYDFPDELIDLSLQSREGGTILPRFADLKRMVEHGDIAKAGITRKTLAAVASFHDRVWTLFGNRPESFAKRALYGSTVDKLMKKGVGPLAAHLKGWEAVDAALFDYSKITTLEDNLRFIFPFIQWARKNVWFWTTKAAQRPVPAFLMYENYDSFKEHWNEDLPEPLQRYARLGWLANVTETIPALNFLTQSLQDSGADPLNLLSVKNLYRVVKNENPLIPADKEVTSMFDGMVEYLEDFGFSMNPLVRKPLEHSGLVDLRTWQMFFPQTSLVEAMTRKYFHERFPQGLNVEHWITDKLLNLIGDKPISEMREESVDQYVRMELAAQAHRGEPLNEGKARKKIEDFLYAQTILGFFTNVYIRRMTPEDIYFTQISTAMHEEQLSFLDLSPEDRMNYRLWAYRDDPVKFQRYVEALPLIRTFYQIDNYFEARKFLKEHFYILPYVEERLGRKNKAGWAVAMQEAALRERTDIAIDFFDLVDKIDLTPETVKAAEAVLVTPELRRYWSLNDTAEDKRHAMLRGQYFREMIDQTRGYHAIPEDDFDAKAAYLAEHPQMQRFWAANDRPSEHVHAILLAFLADLRDRYFEFADAGDWDGASAFLDQFPFTFDKIAETGKYIRDRQTGRPDGGSFGDFDKRRFEFSSFQDSALLASRNAELRSRLRFWQTYWSLPAGKRDEYVAQHGASAGIFVYGLLSSREMYDREQAWLRQAFASGMTERAAHYLYVKPLLDYFFTLTRKQRQLFVRMNPELQDYFDNWANTDSVSGDPKLDKLLDRYFNFPPGSDERSQFIRQHPEVQDFFDERSSPQERALHRLLEVYFEIREPNARKEFLLRHPEIQSYFDRRQRQRENETAILSAFDDADPRLFGFRRGARAAEQESVDRMLSKLTRGKGPSLALDVRKTRQPA
jgi:hypothetical protein